jgi:hypothetical protein
MNESRTNPESDLGKLSELHQAIVTNRRDLAAAVASARLEGASWNAIGRALGISRQAAWKAYATLEERPLSDDAFLPLFTTPQEHTD